MGFQLLLLLLGLVAVTATLAAGPYLRTAAAPRSLLLAQTLVGGVVVILLEAPAHDGTDCGASPAAAFGPRLPGAVYSVSAIACSARLLGSEGVGRPIAMSFGILASCSVAWLVDSATATVPDVPWWSVHVGLQVALLLTVAGCFAPGTRRWVAVLPLVSLGLPILFPTFWHAGARVGLGDTVGTVLEKLEDHWLVPAGSPTDHRVRVRDVEAVELARDGSLLFTAIDGVDACTCSVWFSLGRAVRVEMSPD